ncbi:RNA ligase [Erwinia phage Hena1]|uniref:RNA ligase n=1 Tax=Erwinia phage Hena1 TaxID=2678601 RepID=A0A6B9J9S8_9CAUD|nr:RNA ligase and tail fiber protein attachment catalyst [Erwinia phage Hena1]QGZ16259.1 RNA ligase [Erwinia phage Hena1]
MNKFNVDDLIASGLVRVKTYVDGPFDGLRVFKYHGRVFWDNMWKRDPRLLECRGIVVDSDDNVVLHPFTKIFNRGENKTDLNPNNIVIETVKVNGFMAGATVYNGKWLVSTTGTLDSDYARLAEKVINFDQKPNLVNSKTWNMLDLMFEIVDPSDPHIVHEEPGAYLIGARVKDTGQMLSESALDGLCLPTWKRPAWRKCLFSDTVQAAKTCTHEGFIVRDVESGKLLLKIKSPHYLAKKFFMRGGVKKCEAIWEHGDRVKKTIDEEYYPLLDYLRGNFTKDEWTVIAEQDRRVHIEKFLQGGQSG